MKEGHDQSWLWKVLRIFSIFYKYFSLVLLGSDNLRFVTDWFWNISLVYLSWLGRTKSLATDFAGLRHPPSRIVFLYLISKALFSSY